jgi:Ca-activated chloride channel family protein
MICRRHPSILQRLEAQSLRRNPELHGPQRGKPTQKNHAQRPLIRWQDRVLITMACVLALLLLLRIETAHGQPPADPSWGLTFKAGQQTFHRLALDTSMHAEVSGLVARVHVLQSFRNDSNDWVEGTYRFPLPDGAAVDRMVIKVGERILEGEIRERESAQRVYQQARREGRAAGLVAQERDNQFSTRLANVGPGDTVHIMIGFLATVDYRDGAFRLRLPMTFTPRWGAEPQISTGRSALRPQLASLDEAPGHGLTLKVDLDPGIPLAHVESLYHDVDIQAGESGYEVTLIDPDERTDRAFELRWMPEFGALPRSALTTWGDGSDVYALLMLIPPRDEALDPQSRELVFVIDTSGSMSGASLDQAQAALFAGLEALTPGDRFNLMQFNSTTESVFRGPVPVTDANLETARRWISELEADGGTDMAPALRRALDQSAPVNTTTATDLVRQVVFITDGAVGNESELLREIADRVGERRLFTVGIGAAPNARFMRKAAEIGRGHHTHIGRPEDVASTMLDLWTHIRLPAISDLCIDWGMEAEYYPEVLPDLYAGQPLWVAARLGTEPDGVELCGQLNDQPWVHDAWPRIEPGTDLLSTLWAQRKVDALQDSVLFGADAGFVRAEATQVALAHNLLTPFTSLVAVDRSPSRPMGETLADTQVPSLLPAGSTVSTAFPATATGWKTQLLLSAIALGITTALFLRPFAPLPRWPSTVFRSPVRHLRRRQSPARP